VREQPVIIFFPKNPTTRRQNCQQTLIFLLIEQLTTAKLNGMKMCINRKSVVYSQPLNNTSPNITKYMTLKNNNKLITEMELKNKYKLNYFHVYMSRHKKCSQMISCAPMGQNEGIFILQG
jgi:uncharacterized protein YpuA (DUF1002 family)